MKVTRITTGRLFSLGNYEHVRHEITVEIGEGESAAEAMSGLNSIMEGLRPVSRVTMHTKESIARERAELERILAKSQKDFELYTAATDKADYRKARTEQIDEAEQKLKEAQARYDAAVSFLDNLGGASKLTDAKQDWQQE